jgi:hypothetical protein
MHTRFSHALRVAITVATVFILQLGVTPPAAGQSVVPAPWSSSDVGNPALAGSATENQGVFTVNGAGADIWGSSDQFHFVHQLLTGDGMIVAVVENLGATDGWAKAGLMMRESLAAGSRHVSVLVTPSNGVAVEARKSTNGTTTSGSWGYGRAPHVLLLQRQGNTIVSYGSADGSTWRYLGTMVISLPETIYVGLATTSHRTTTRTAGVFSNVMLDGATTNQPPTVQITAPASAASFTAPATINITASASDPDGTVSKVEFYRGTTLIATDTTSPFSTSVNVTSAGTLALSAVATDNAGATGRSATVNVTVGAAQTTATPYGGTAAAVPGTIQAENFDEGGSGVAYSDTSAGNSGGKYRSTDVDIEVTSDTGGGYNVGWVSAGEWLQYTVNVARAGTYTLEARVASAGAGGLFHVEVNGVNVSGSMTVTNTGSWQTWQTVTKTVTLSAGTQRLRLSFDSVGSSGGIGNFNYLRLTEASTTPPPAPAPIKAVFSASPDHGTLVNSYRLNVFAASANPATATPLTTVSLGKPAPVSGTITVDITSGVSALAPGTYIATVSAIGNAGTSTSTPSASFVK